MSTKNNDNPAFGPFGAEILRGQDLKNYRAAPSFPEEKPKETKEGDVAKTALQKDELAASTSIHH